KIMEDEIFGPLLPILTYSDLGKLLAKIKSLPKPLAGYAFSRNQQAIDRVLQSLSFGGGAVNQTNVFLFIEAMPYGGVGTSGIGNYYGKYGYDSLTRQIGPDISARRSYRSLVSALHQRKGASAQPMVRLLGERSVRDGTFGTPKVHQYGRRLLRGACLIECSRSNSSERGGAGSD